MACSACSAPAFWCMPTTCAGRAGLMERILSSVFSRFPPMIRSYSRPNCDATSSSAPFIARALSGDLKSVKGSFANPPRGERGRIEEKTIAAVTSESVVIAELV